MRSESAVEEKRPKGLAGGGERSVEDSPPQVRVPKDLGPPGRLGSLDAFRGLTILGMLLVNNMALDSATPQSLTHAPWGQGVYLADLVFPWFLLIVGVALPFTASAHFRKGLSLSAWSLKVLRRAVMLVLLGCLIDSSLARHPIFGLGVLQLIGLSYAVAALLRGLPGTWRLVVAAFFLVAHWAAIRFLPIPGAGAGIFTEEINVISHLNQAYLEPLHLKGLLSLIPTSALVLLGTVLGEELRRQSAPPMRRFVSLLLGGLAFAATGWLWSMTLPFSKQVWSASYILYTAGLGSVVLGFFYLAIDVMGWRVWAFPLVIFGSNALMAYIVPILVKAHILQEWIWTMSDGSSTSLQQAFLQYCVTLAGRIGGGWLYTLSYIIFWWVALLILHRRRIFWRV